MIKRESPQNYLSVGEIIDANKNKNHSKVFLTSFIHEHSFGQNFGS